MKQTDKYTFFYKSSECFSNWFPCTFTEEYNVLTGEEITDGPDLEPVVLMFNSTEQYMMYYKALLFEDTETATQIMQSAFPREQKALGRRVKGFDISTWSAHAKKIMFSGCFLKFTQNEELRKELMDTGNTILVEASRQDIIWGIGMYETDEGVESPKNWKGSNWLGETLTLVKQSILLFEQH